MQVQFKTHNDGVKDIELCQITYDDGRVHAFPASEVVAGQTLTFAQAYPSEYSAFKAEKPKPEVETVEVLRPKQVKPHSAKARSHK